MKKVAIFLMIMSIIGKLLGFGKYIALSYYYGTGIVSDAYVIAITIPTVIFAFIGIALSTSYIPIYNSVRNEKGKEYANNFTSSIIKLLFLISTIIVLIVLFNTEFIVKLFASGFNKEAIDLTCRLTRVSIFGVYFTGNIYMLNSFLQMQEKYIVPAVAEIPINILTIFAIYLSSRGNFIYLQLGDLVGVILQFTILLVFCIKNGFSYKFGLLNFDKYVKKLLTNSLPAIVGISVNQINVIVDRTFASKITSGGVSALNYSSRLNDAAQSIIVFSIIAIVYPQISKMLVQRNYEGTNRTIQKTIVSLTLLIVPLSVGLIFFSNQIIMLIYARGEFDIKAINLTSGCLIFYSIGMIGVGLRELTSRVFYSLQDTLTPMINASISILINIILIIVLSKYMGVSGIALATSISAICATILMFISLRKKIELRGVKRTSIKCIKIFFASLSMGIVAKVFYRYMVIITANNNISVIGTIGIAVLTYFIIIYFMRIDEVNEVVNSLRTKICIKFNKVR